ncbi:MAG: hypothetical protein ACUVR4_11610 [Anaerolineae bacterium]
MLFLKTPPSQRRFALSRIALAVLLGLVASLSVGCQPAIRVFQPEPLPRPVATVVPLSHELAVVGIDFDPPLDYEQIMAAGGISLIVAVHNGGHYQESDVLVTAQLLDPLARDNAATLLHETATIEALEPGDIRLVRFGQVTALPLRGRYKLMVQVSPVAGEPNRADNTRVYEIVVNGAR